jgi:hypothetical protein
MDLERFKVLLVKEYDKLIPFSNGWQNLSTNFLRGNKRKEETTIVQLTYN